nr:DUF350 domain-containing protein [Oceanisphaera psychrotolerans]
MDALLTSLSGLGPFLLYFSLSILMLLLFKWLYVLVTPWDEWKLIKENQNLAAAIALVGAFVGFSLAVASAAANSVSLLDFAVWGLIALVAQLLAFAWCGWYFCPGLPNASTKARSRPAPWSAVCRSPWGCSTPPASPTEEAL